MRSLTNPIRIGSIIALACILLYGLSACAPKVPDTDKLFLQNFLPYPNVMVKLDRDTATKDQLYNFFLAYRDRDFKESLRLADQIQPLEASNPLQLYRAVCLMSLEQYEAAKLPLLNLSKVEGEYQDAARWYLALSHLKLGQIADCKKELTLIKNTSTYIRNEAKVLISKLNN